MDIELVDWRFVVSMDYIHSGTAYEESTPTSPPYIRY